MRITQENAHEFNGATVQESVLVDIRDALERIAWVAEAISDGLILARGVVNPPEAKP